jgi:hypothetical protein
MKSLATNTLGYTGVVTLSRYHNNKKYELIKIHNNGKSPLFDFLADCLIGNYEAAAQSRPTMIKLLKVTSSEGATDSLESASGFIALMTTPEKINKPNGGGVRYSFIVTRDMVFDTNFNRIGLYTKAVADNAISDQILDEYAAYCDVKDSGIASGSLSASSALLIDWELIISNKETNNV